MGMYWKWIAAPAIVLGLWTTQASAADRTASLAQLPALAESETRGILVDLIKAMDKATGTTTKIIVAPFQRSMKNVADGQADYHLPILDNPERPAQLDGLMLGRKTTVVNARFGLYTHKDRPVDLAKADQFRLETEAAHTDLFPMKIAPSTCLECSLRKILADRIDGVVFAMLEMDKLLASLEGKENIRRSVYRVYRGTAILPANAKGEATDAFLADAIEKLKQNGEYQRILGPLLEPNSD
ncbi:MAG TPA: transporter substrate-binding domain-containing protein [Azospirillaceae bacterium]|nr:transporter substrate-binding domain-containing protein [Azospirillaceae bacterium]